jgi:hypothetical protein
MRPSGHPTKIVKSLANNQYDGSQPQARSQRVAASPLLIRRDPTGAEEAETPTPHCSAPKGTGPVEGDGKADLTVDRASCWLANPASIAEKTRSSGRSSDTPRPYRATYRMNSRPAVGLGL